MSIDIKDKSIFKHDKKALLILNTYNGSSYCLGQPVLNDGKLMERYLKEYGYECVKMIDKGMTEVLKAIEKLLKNTKEALIYYSGHGAQVGYNKDEDDRKNEAFCFLHRMFFLEDDTLSKCIQENNRTNKLILFNDCCHSATIWDLEKINVKDNQVIYNISACEDYQTAAQLAQNGALTSIFWSNFDIKTNKLNFNKFTRALHHFGQAPVISKNNRKIIDDYIEINF